MSPAERLLQSIVSTARVAFRSAACSVARLDPEGDALVFVAADGEGADSVVGMTLPVGRGIAGWAVVSGQAIAVADVADDVRFDADTAEKTGYVPSVILAAPVIAEGEAVGVMEVLDPKLEADLELLGRFADLAGLALAMPSVVDTPLPQAEQALVDAVLRYTRER